MMSLLSWLSPGGPRVLVYMLQQFEYNPAKFLAWVATGPSLATAKKRGSFVPTKRAKLMLLIAYATYIVWMVGVAYLIMISDVAYGVLVLLALPLVAFVLLAISSGLQVLVVNPRQQAETNRAKQKLQSISATKIAVLGSYGKTSMKELLLTVLSEGMTVAATPGNKNVLVSHARWVNSDVVGNEDVLIFEYGEAEPGDIAQLASFSKPTMAVVTGLAPAHLDYYPTLESVADDFASIAEIVSPDQVLCNDVSRLLTNKMNGVVLYDETGADGWAVSQIKVSFDGTSFVMSKGKHKLRLRSGLLGAHQVGPIVAAVVIAKKLGLSDEQVVSGVAKTKPYEHRMEPRHLYGAWIIDDAYNGNIEGMKAGLALLKALPAVRRVYVTPGLVDQGIETERVHIELGRRIGEASPDKVVLMQNSVAQFIKTGLTESEFDGEVQVETDPLAYYNSLDQQVAAGDVVMLQNDWPDSYA